jgi:hypothetical protein
MTGPVRVRRHTDGRIAINYGTLPLWIIHTEGQCSWRPEDVTGPGWSELFVAELPPPDQIGEASAKQWSTFGDHGFRMTVYANGIQFRTQGGGEVTYGPDKVEALRDATLKTLAAIAAYDELRDRLAR